jgi:hypothetical protein
MKDFMNFIETEEDRELRKSIDEAKNDKYGHWDERPRKVEGHTPEYELNIGHPDIRKQLKVTAKKHGLHTKSAGPETLHFYRPNEMSPRKAQSILKHKIIGPKDYYDVDEFDMSEGIKKIKDRAERGETRGARRAAVEISRHADSTEKPEHHTNAYEAWKVYGQSVQHPSRKREARENMKYHKSKMKIQKSFDSIIDNFYGENIENLQLLSKSFKSGLSTGMAPERFNAPSHVKPPYMAKLPALKKPDTFYED